jgi:hypothetical protein
LVATATGAVKTRSARRIPVEDRWSKDTLKWVRHVPWNRGSGDLEVDGDVPDDVTEEPEAILTMEGQKPNVIIVSTKEAKPRGLYITEKDLIAHGFTRGCGGCSSIQRGTGRQPHNEKCRGRFAEILKNVAKTKNAEKRKQAVVDAAGQEPEEKRRREEASSASRCGQKRVGDDIEDMSLERPMIEHEVERKDLKRGREDGESEMVPSSPDARRKM